MKRTVGYAVSVNSDGQNESQMNLVVGEQHGLVKSKTIDEEDLDRKDYNKKLVDDPEIDSAKKTGLAKKGKKKKKVGGPKKGKSDNVDDVNLSQDSDRVYSKNYDLSHVEAPSLTSSNIAARTKHISQIDTPAGQYYNTVGGMSRDPSMQHLSVEHHLASIEEAEDLSARAGLADNFGSVANLAHMRLSTDAVVRRNIGGNNTAAGG